MERVYELTALQLINNNIADAWGGKTLKKGIVDLLDPTPDESRTKDEIIDQIWSKIDGRI